MTIRDRRRRRFQVELLERRDTPGAVGGGPGAIHAAAAHRAALILPTPTGPVAHPFVANGHSVGRPAQALQSDGTILAQGAIAGSATGLGPFRGTLLTSYSVPLRTYDGVSTFRAVLRFDTGDELDLRFLVVYGGGNYNPHFDGSFYVTGGTGRFADAVGSGGANGTGGMSTSAFNFHLEGPVYY